MDRRRGSAGMGIGEALSIECLQQRRKSDNSDRNLANRVKRRLHDTYNQIIINLSSNVRFGSKAAILLFRSVLAGCLSYRLLELGVTQINTKLVP